MGVRDYRQRDRIADENLGSSLGNTAGGIIRGTKVLDGYIYWNSEALLFIANENIFSNGNLLKLNFSDIGLPNAKYLLWNGELHFTKAGWSFLGQTKYIKKLENSIKEYLRNGSKH